MDGHKRPPSPAEINFPSKKNLCMGLGPDLGAQTQFDIDFARLACGLGIDKLDIVLECIVFRDPKLNRKYANAKNARELITENQELKDLLIEAIKTERFTAVRSHPSVQTWNIDYKGGSAQLLIQALTDMNSERKGRPYDNCVPIIQSSGTGKSRTVDEVAKSIFTLPFNLRPDEDETGFPRPDNAIRAALTIERKSSRNQLQGYYLSVFKNLFLHVAHEIKDMPNCQTFPDFALAWYQKLKDLEYRNQLYTRAVKDSEGDEPHLRSERLTEIMKEARDALKDLLLQINEKSGCVVTSSGPEPMIKPVRLLLYFDESHALLSQWTREDPASSREKQSKWSAYQVLCKMFNNFTAENLFVVYLSTKLNLSKYSPQKKVFWSARGDTEPIRPIDDLQAPFVELPFDTWIQPCLIDENSTRLSDISTPNHMTKFGRPLFWTRWMSSDYSVRDDIFEFAKLKILGTRNVSPDHVRDGKLAAISIRVMLDFDPGREEAVITEGRLVEGHMRMAYSVPKHREYLRSGTPSEPVLAEAAARIMNESGPEATLTMMSDVTKSGLISKGERGEIVARLLLTLARDQCVKPQHISIAYCSQPIRLFDFLEELVGPENMTKIYEARPDNIPGGATFKEAFKDAQINFTHFGKGANGSIITDKAAWLALARCMAWQCANGQYMIDLYIPILLWDELLGRFVVSGIFIQIKNRFKEQPNYIDERELEFFAPGDDKANTRPYITIIMQLGVQPLAVKAGTKTKQKVRASTPSKLELANAPTRHQPSRSAKVPRNAKLIHPRYAISIVGCSSTVYKVIGDKDKPTYTRLLASQSLMDEHPRSAQPFRDAVSRMKPSWSEDLGSFHWGPQDDVEMDDDIEEQDGIFVRQHGDSSESDED